MVVLHSCSECVVAFTFSFSAYLQVAHVSMRTCVQSRTYIRKRTEENTHDALKHLKIIRRKHKNVLFRKKINKKK